MEIDRIPTPPPLISEDDQWNLFLEDDPDFDLSMFFSQALEMMDEEEKAEKEEKRHKEEKEQEKEIDEGIKEKEISGENTVPGAANHAQANVCNSTENDDCNMVSSKFSEELKTEMAAFLRKLEPRQGPTDF